MNFGKMDPGRMYQKPNTKFNVNISLMNTTIVSEFEILFVCRDDDVFMMNSA